MLIIQIFCERFYLGKYTLEKSCSELYLEMKSIYLAGMYIYIIYLSLCIEIRNTMYIQKKNSSSFAR